MTGLTLFFEFFKVGIFCFGGAFGMIPVIKDVVLSHAWMTEAEFYGFLGICESTPGPIAVNLATHIGFREGGLLGSVLAVAGVTIPSFVIILLIASVLKTFTENRYFKAVMSGIRPVVAALIIHTGISFLISTIGFDSTFAISIKPAAIILALTAIYALFRLAFKKKLSSVLIIIISAFLGIAVNMIFNAANV